MRRFGFLKVLIFLVIFSIPFIITSCGGGGGSGSTQTEGNSQAVLGPLSGAIIKAYKLDNLTTPIEVTTAAESNDTKTAGTFTLNLKGIPDNEWILVTASKGIDIDPYDNNTTASVKVQNQGIIHALAKASDWRKGGKINILTELAWQEIEPEIKTDNSTSIENQLDLLTTQLLSDDVNGDGKIDYKDLLTFNPENKKDRYKLSFSFSDIMRKGKDNSSLIDYIHSNKPDQEKNKISFLFGDKLGLPTAPIKLISVKPIIVLPDNSTISPSSLKVSSFFSDNATIEDSNKATILMANDSKGDTVLLGYALPNTYTKTIARRLIDRGGNTFIRLASGYRGNNPELSPESTALTLVMMMAGGNSLTHDERTAIINYVLNSSDFKKLVSDISNAIATNPTFLHNILAKEYEPIVTEIKAIAKNAINNYIDTIKNEKLISYLFYNTTITRSSSDITLIQPTEIDGFHLFSPWRADQPWYWYGNANYTDVTAPPFLAENKYNNGLFALANPDNIYYAALFYNKSGKLVNWYFTKRNRDMIEKVFNSGAAQRALYYGGKINNSIAHIQFNKDWFSGGWGWSDGALPVRLVHFLDLSISVIDVLADAGPLKKVVSGFTKYGGNIQSALKASGCIAEITDIMSFGNNNIKDFLSDAVLPTLKAVPKCTEPILKEAFKGGIKGGFKSLLNSTIPKLVLKISNPEGWVAMLAESANNLIPFGTSLLFAPSTVGYDISWIGDRMLTVKRDDNWVGQNQTNNGNLKPGSLYESFGNGGIVTYQKDYEDFGYSSAIDSENRIVVAGFILNGDTYKMALWRYRPDGTLDTSFGTNGVVIYNNYSFDGSRGVDVTVDSEGRIIVVGYFLSGSNTYMAVWRYTSSGRLDTSFNEGKGFYYYPDKSKGISVTLDRSGNILVAGQLSGNEALWKINSNGILDTNFGNNGVIDDYQGKAYSVKTDLNGNIYLASRVDFNGDGKWDIILEKFYSNGGYNNSFGQYGVAVYDSGENDWPTSMTIDSKGEILVLGNIDGTYDYSTGKYRQLKLAVLKYDTITGKLDKFITTSDSYGVSITTDNKGRILIAGRYSDGYNYMGLWRYQSDGKKDTNFGNDGFVKYGSNGNNDGGNHITIDNNNKIIVTGIVGAKYSFDQGYNVGGCDMAIWKYEP